MNSLKNKDMDTGNETRINSYLTFKIGKEEYGAEVQKVLNILELKEITKVPNMPQYMKGVINLRGMILPVIDTRIKFNMSPTEYTDKTCIVVMDLNIDNEVLHIGALVDTVVAVHEIDDSIIGPPPGIGSAYKAEFITGMAKMKDQFIMILDLIKLFTGDELEMLSKSSNKDKAA